MKRCIIVIISVLVSLQLCCGNTGMRTSYASNEKMPIHKENKKIIVIDAGHQKRGNYEREAIAPGAKETKPKVSSGTQGKFTRIPEYELNLAVAEQLKEILLKRGYIVYMTREKNEVNISNRERADFANRHHADAFIRIHANGCLDSSVHGALTICPNKQNPYCKRIYTRSYKLAKNILNEMIKTTKANCAGITQTDSMSGINWSKVPVTIVEMGYMTNHMEDVRLADKSYRLQVATGIANGLDHYFNQ